MLNVLAAVVVLSVAFGLAFGILHLITLAIIYVSGMLFHHDLSQAYWAVMLAWVLSMIVLNKFGVTIKKES